jgi:hypothetical protein
MSGGKIDPKIAVVLDDARRMRDEVLSAVEDLALELRKLRLKPQPEPPDIRRVGDPAWQPDPRRGYEVLADPSYGMPKPPKRIPVTKKRASRKPSRKAKR